MRSLNIQRGQGAKWLARLCYIIANNERKLTNEQWIGGRGRHTGFCFCFVFVFVSSFADDGPKSDSDFFAFVAGRF